MKSLILIINNKHKAALGNLRTQPEISAALNGDDIWLLCPGEKAHKLSGLPARQTYSLDEENRLFPMGGQTPTELLPELEWQALQDFLPVEPPVSAQPARITERLSFKLSPSDKPQAGYALLCSLASWQAYALDAPKSRLDRLDYCLSEKGEVLIAGTPLPPIPGQEFWRRGQFLLPAGLDLEFPLLAQAASKLLSTEKDQLLCFDAQGIWEAIPMQNFTRAARSSILQIAP